MGQFFSRHTQKTKPTSNLLLLKLSSTWLGFVLIGPWWWWTPSVEAQPGLIPGDGTTSDLWQTIICQCLRMTCLRMDLGSSMVDFYRFGNGIPSFSNPLLQCLRKVANLVGPPLRIDLKTAGSESGEHARFRIPVSITEPLQENLFD